MRKWIIARRSIVSDHVHMCAVTGKTIDEAIDKAVKKYPYTTRQEWDVIEEVDPECFLGMLGEDI